MVQLDLTGFLDRHTRDSSVSVIADLLKLVIKVQWEVSNLYMHNVQIYFP